MNLTSVKDIRQFLADHDLSPLKKFGQNFLCDGNIVEKIADTIDWAAAPYVLEIGTGLGALTQALCKRAEQVVSVEIDKGLIATHTQTLGDAANLSIIESDILKLDLQDMCGKYFMGKPFHICGNLPYYITSKILLHILESGAPVKSVTVMMQKEVADRLGANAGETAYGALTASCRYYTQPEILFTVSKNCFYPAPDVDSAIVRMDLSCPPLNADRENYVKTVRSAFAMRRKTIYNNLKQVASAGCVSEALKSENIPENARAQDIAPEKFAALSHRLFG